MSSRSLSRTSAASQRLCERPRDKQSRTRERPQRSMRWVPPLLAVLVLAACGGGSDDAGGKRPVSDDIYAYNASRPIARQDAGLAYKDYPIAIHDISFDGGKEPVPAFLLLPPGKGPYPAVIYLHGQGGDRLEMLYSASWIAARRAVALTVESPYSPNRAIELGNGVQGLRRSATERSRASSSCAARSIFSSPSRRWTTRRS